MNKVIKGIKLRLYPNQSQREQLWQMFGNDRFVWNQMLGMAKERYQNNPNSLFVNEYGMNYLLKQLKCEYAFLRESDSTSFLVVNHNLAQAFKMLFKHGAVIRISRTGTPYASPIQDVRPVRCSPGEECNCQNWAAFVQA